MKIVKTEFKEGEGSTGFTKDFARFIYDQEPAYADQDFDAYFIRNWVAITSTPRWEYTVYNDDGSVEASMAFYVGFHKEFGQQVIYVMNAFSKRSGLLAGGYKWGYKKCKELGLPFFCYTKRCKELDTPTKFMSYSYEWRIK